MVVKVGVHDGDGRELFLVGECSGDGRRRSNRDATTIVIFITSSNDSNMSILGWWIVQTAVLPMLTIFLTARMTVAAALASRPDVGSSINIIDGFATSSTAIVSRFLCSVDKPLMFGIPTNSSRIFSSSTVSRTNSTKSCGAKNSEFC
ncbi:hypothetical protein M5K25_021684 [Dendrobium thyrsiflorum]|uniref:Uncharacterized protein n=1 Tax=Dendrobium thyrsiflorum TaxID=117978 RepID=A0ABD0U519_DENTH